MRMDTGNDTVALDTSATDAGRARRGSPTRNGARGERLAAATQPPHAHDDGSNKQRSATREQRVDASRTGASAVIAPHLLPLQDRLAYFRSQLLSHRKLDDIYTELLDAIADPGDKRMALLYGPTRVGKTTALDKVVREYETKRDQAQMAGTWNPGHIPILRLAIPATGERPVSFRDIYWRILHAAQEPLIEQKRALEPVQAWKAGLPVRSASEADLRWAVESMLRHRRPAAVLLDEAQHLAQRRSAAALEAQLDCLKSLAEETRVIYVLAGSYELLSFRDNKNAQLIARSRNLHFSRYQLEEADDIKEFRRVVYSFGARLPFEHPPDLERHWQFLYRFSGGIVGVVKTWLYQALKLALTQDATTLTKEHLTRSAYELSQVNTIITQAVAGETALRLAENVLAKIDTSIGFSTFSSTPVPPRSGHRSERGVPPTRAPDATQQTSLTSGQADEQHPDPARAAAAKATTPLSTRTRTAGRKRVGERKPGRDRAGLDPLTSGGSPYRI